MYSQSCVYIEWIGGRWTSNQNADSKKVLRSKSAHPTHATYRAAELKQKNLTSPQIAFSTSHFRIQCSFKEMNERSLPSGFLRTATNTGFQLLMKQDIRISGLTPLVRLHSDDMYYKHLEFANYGTTFYKLPLIYNRALLVLNLGAQLTTLQLN